MEVNVYKNYNILSLNDLISDQSTNLYNESILSSTKQLNYTWQNHIDLCITIGSDGTILRASSLFPKYCPPMLSFYCSNVGFLSPHSLNSLDNLFKNIFNNNNFYLKRERLEFTVINDNIDYSDEELENLDWFVKLNEVVLKRTHKLTGIAEIDCYIDDNYLARYQGDGVLVASPTGSTAYSMACGGSIVHPELDALLLTSLNSMSLSSRPVILPAHSIIRLKGHQSEVFLEGKSGRAILASEAVLIRKSRFPLICFSRVIPAYDWIYDLGSRLSFERQVRVRPDHKMNLINYKANNINKPL